MQGREMYITLFALIFFALATLPVHATAVPEDSIKILRENGTPKIVEEFDGNYVYVPVMVKIDGDCKGYRNNDTMIAAIADGNVRAIVYGLQLDPTSCSVQFFANIGTVEETDGGKTVSIKAAIMKPKNGRWVPVLESNAVNIWVAVADRNVQLRWMTPQEEQEKETEWEIHVDSPYPHEYTIKGNMLNLTLHVNYIAPNSCYGIEPVVERGTCANCYVVYITERKPAPDMVCAQVIREIPTADVEIGPLDPAEKEVRITVKEKKEQEGGKPVVQMDCIKIEGKIYQLQRDFQRCIAGECDEAYVEELRERYEELATNYEEMNCGEPPKLPKIPAPPEIPKKPKKTPQPEETQQGQQAKRPSWTIYSPATAWTGVFNYVKSLLTLLLPWLR